MNSVNFKDLVPRPSPKPSQIEVPVISNGPEVPEASLLFDSCVRKSEPAKVLPPKYPSDTQKYAGNLSVPSYSVAPYSPPSDFERKVSNKHECSNCCYNRNSESPRAAGDVASLLPRLDYTPGNQNVNFGYDGKNGPYTKKQYSHFLPQPKTCLTDHTASNANQSFVTLDEYQKMVSQFTNMILNLNYKFNQLLDSSISHEELNQITRKFEFQMENLTHRVNELNSKLDKANSELASRPVVEYKCCPRSYESPTRQVNERKCYQIDDRPTVNFEKECNDNHQVLGQSQKSPGIMKMCPRLSNQQHRDLEHRDHRCVNIEDFQRERISGGRLSIRGTMPVDPISENTELENVMSNLDLVPPNDTYKQCYSSHEPRLPSNGVITSSDMSRLMNSLATKYIPEGQFDMKKQDSSQEQDAMIRNDGNNVSIATLQYMERYQLLSSTNQNSTKPVGVSKTRSMSNQQQFYHQEVLEGNDRSFVR